MDHAALVKEIDRVLKHGDEFGYVNPHNTSRITFLSVTLPHGPIYYIRRKKGQHTRSCRPEAISVAMLQRIASQIAPHEAFTMEAVLKGSGNSRSVVEAILAQLPQFFVCYPAKILNGTFENVKHLYLNPDKPHRMKEVTEALEIKGVMKKVPMASPHLVVPDHSAPNFTKLRLHQQIQVKIFEIGAAMRWHVWIAENDRNIKLGRKHLHQHSAAVQYLAQMPFLQGFPEAQAAAKHLDIALFGPGGLVPAIIEIEQSTGITSGLNRMEKFRRCMPGVFGAKTSFIICAEDDKKDEVMRKAAKAPQFLDLAPRFLPYSHVNLMWSICVNGQSVALKDNLFEAFSEACC